MDMQFLEALKRGDHVDNKEAWQFAHELCKRYPLEEPDSKLLKGVFSEDIPDKFLIQHNRGTLLNYITLALHKETPNRATFYLCDMKYKLVYDKYNWSLYNCETSELLLVSHVFDPIISYLSQLEN